MKKGLLFVVAAFSVFSLTACDLFNKGNKEEEKPTADSTVYGTGAEDLVLTVGSAIPAGEYVATFKAPSGDDSEAMGFVGVYQGSVGATNMIWEDFFETNSMCKLKVGQVVNLKYATLQNIESNPRVGALKNGTFKVGTHFQAGANGLVTVRSLSGSGQVILYSQLSDTGYYLDGDYPAVNNLASEEVKEFLGVPNGTYIMLNGAEIVL